MKLVINGNTEKSVVVGLVEAGEHVALTLNDIKIAFVSAESGKLFTYGLDVRDANTLTDLGIQIQNGPIGPSIACKMLYYEYRTENIT